jgi:hypothetical protein
MRVTSGVTDNLNSSNSDVSSPPTSADNMILGPPVHKGSSDVSVVFGNPNEFDLTLSPDTENFKLGDDGETETITITLEVGDVALANNYKILIGLRNNDVTISEYVTLNVLS